MSDKIKISAILAISIVLFGCTKKYEDVYTPESFGTNENIYIYDCPTCRQNVALNDEYVSLDNYRTPTKVLTNGVKTCPPHQRCLDRSKLPPRPCAQPMPTYYGNVSAKEVEDGIVLIHPFTRTKAICYDDRNMSAGDCARMFQNKGYVLVTDIPQLPARYDFLKQGNYPARRWRGNGEVVPRW